MPDTRLKEELSSLRRRHESASARANESEKILGALTAILGERRPDCIGATIFDSFRGLVAFEAAFVLTLDADGVAHVRFSTHPVREHEPVPRDMLARVASGRAATLPDARRADVLAPFLPSGSDPVSVMMVPFAARRGGGLILFVQRGFGLYQAEEAFRLKRFGIVAAQGLSALEEIRLAQDFDRVERDREIAHAANLAKSRLLSRVSHELRTPLNGVLGSAYLLGIKDMPGDCAEMVANIEECGKEMLRLISDLIEFASAAAPDADQTHAEPLGQAMGLLVGQFRVPAAASGLGIELRISAEAGAVIIPGVSALRRVLAVLLDNAVKYAGVGTVIVECAVADGALRLDVSDSGPGMSAELAATVFEPFRRGDASLTTRVDGLGLGLPLAARLVGELGGRIGLDTAPGAGVRISVRLPLDRAGASAAPHVRPVERSQSVA